MNQGFYLTLMMGPLTFEPAPRYLVDALTSVEITSSAEGRSGFQLTFSAGKSSKIVRELLPTGFFDAPRRVILVLTMSGSPTVLMDGIITRQDFTPSNDPGQSTLSITGTDVSQAMDLIDLTGMPWPGMPPEARVALMLARYAMFGVVPLVIPSPLTFIENPVDKHASQQGTDYAYIKKLADRTGYVFYIEPGPKPGMNLAYWGPPNKFSPPQPALTVNSDAHSNVEALSFSFDGLAKKQFIFYVNIKETKTSIPIPVPDISPINPPLGLKQPIPLGIEYLNQASTKDEGTAKLAVAEAVMRGLAKTSQAADVITASGTLDVARYGRVLKARQLVGVRGAGYRLRRPLLRA